MTDEEPMDEEEELASYDAVCLTPGCENEGLLIRVRSGVTDPQVYCGACVDENGYNTRITTLIPVEAEEGP